MDPASLAQRPGPVRRHWHAMRRTSLLAVAAALIVIVWFAVTGGRHFDPVDDPAALVPSSPASVQPVASTSPPAEPSDLDPDTAWWKVDVGPGVRGQIVRIGTLGAGETATIEVELAGDTAAVAGGVAMSSPIVGPSAGRVVLLGRDGRQSVLTSVHAATGEATELVRTDQWIADAGLAGTELIFLTADRVDGTPLAVFRMDAAGGAEPQRIEGLLGERPSIRNVAIVEWITDLVVSADGKTLVVYRCVQQECELRAMSLDDGGMWRHRLEWGVQPTAAVGGLAVIHRPCVDVDCRLELLDLQSGLMAPVPATVDRPITDAAITRDPALVVTALPVDPAAAEGQGGPGLEIVDLATMQARRQPVELGLIGLVHSGDWSVGIELPAGTVLVQGSPERFDGVALPEMAYFLIDLQTGAATAIPILGELPGQG